MKKGFTLIELVATLIVLSIIAVIVIPNIYNSIKDYREQLYNTQLTSIETATKNWVADHVDDENFPKKNNGTLFIYLNELQNGGYIDDDLKNPLTSSQFNNLVFTVITCKVVEADDYNSENYKYTYRAIDTTKKYLQYLAELWINDNKIDLTNIANKSEVLARKLTKTDLVKYIDVNLLETNTNSIKDIETSTLISNYSANIYATKTDSGYTYRYEGIIG